ncbi:MAG: hypothetical protein V4632_04200 [Pseudomonadota bacterium]
MTRSLLVLSFFGILCSLSLALFFQGQVDWLAELGISGLFVPDAVSLKGTTMVYWLMQEDARSWNTFRTLFGVMLVYWPGMIWGTAGIAATNFLLLMFASAIFVKSIKAFELNRNAVFLVSVMTLLMVLGNIYLIEVILFPNKEIPLIALTNLFIYFLIVRQKIIGALLTAAAAFFFRDGYGIVLVISTIFVYVSWFSTRETTAMLLGGFSLILAFLPSAYLAQIDHSLERNIALGNVIDQSYEQLISGPIGYYFKILGNALNLALRPQFLDEMGGLYLLHVGFWQLGIVIVAGLAWSTYKIARGSENEKNLASVIWIVLLAISYSSYVQPRYLMPLIFWLAMALASSPKSRWIGVGIGIMGTVLFSAADLLPPRAYGIDEVDWSW